MQAVQIDVNPPRATKMRKRLRRTAGPLPVLAQQGREAGRGLLHSLFKNLEIPDVPELAICCRFVVPGWAQWYCGYVIRARIFFFSYLLLLLSGLAGIGTGRGTLLLGLAIACHAASILEFVRTMTDGVHRRLMLGLATLSILMLAIYIPAWTTFTRYFQPVVIMANSGSLQRGDVVIVNPIRKAKPGDVVRFLLHDTTLTAAYQERRIGNVLLTGSRIDRILAGPGQQVVLREGKLLIDGKPPLYEPLNIFPYQGTLNTAVPTGHWLIFPNSR